jgi:hypothetical protein
MLTDARDDQPQQFGTLLFILRVTHRKPPCFQGAIGPDYRSFTVIAVFLPHCDIDQLLGTARRRREQQ